MNNKFFEMLTSRGSACPQCKKKSIRQIGYTQNENGEYVVAEQNLSCDSRECKEKAGDLPGSKINFVDKAGIEFISSDLDKKIYEILDRLSKSCKQSINPFRSKLFMDPPAAQ